MQRLQEQQTQGDMRQTEHYSRRHGPQNGPRTSWISPPEQFRLHEDLQGSSFSGAPARLEEDPTAGPTPSSVLELCQRLKSLVAACREDISFPAFSTPQLCPSRVTPLGPSGGPDAAQGNAIRWLWDPSSYSFSPRLPAPVAVQSPGPEGPPGASIGETSDRLDGPEWLHQKLGIMQKGRGHPTEVVPPLGDRRVSPKLLLQQSPASVEASLRRAAETWKKEIQNRETEARGSSEEGSRKAREHTSEKACSSKEGTCGLRIIDPYGPSSNPAKGRKWGAQHAAAPRVLLRLHSIQFCFDKGHNRGSNEAETRRVSYCVAARFLPCAVQHKPEEDPPPSFTTAWFAAVVSRQSKTEPDRPSPAAEADAESADAHAEGFYWIERCSFETDISLFVPHDAVRQYLDPNKLFLEIWRHDLGVDAAEAPAAQEEAAASSPAAAQGVQQVGEAVIDLLEEGQALKGKCIVPIENPTKEKDTEALVASLGRSGTIHATILSVSPSPQQQEREQKQKHQPDCAWQGTPEDIVRQNKLEAREKMWLYIDDNGKMQGPFSSTQMFLWIRKGYFEEVTPVFDIERRSVKLLLREVAALIATEAQRTALSPCSSSTRETTQSDSGSTVQQLQHDRLQLPQPQRQQQQRGVSISSAPKTAQEPFPVQLQQQQRPQQPQQQQQHQGIPQPPASPTTPPHFHVGTKHKLLFHWQKHLKGSSHMPVQLCNRPRKFESSAFSALEVQASAEVTSKCAAAPASHHHQQQHQRPPSPMGPPLNEDEVKSVFASLDEASRCLRNIKKHKMSSYLKYSIAAPSPNANFRCCQQQKIQQLSLQQQQHSQQHQQQQPQRQPKQRHLQQDSLSRMYVRQRLTLLKEAFGEEALYEACAVYIQAAFRGWRDRRCYLLRRGGFPLPGGPPIPVCHHSELKIGGRYGQMYQPGFGFGDRGPAYGMWEPPKTVSPATLVTWEPPLLSSVPMAAHTGSYWRTLTAATPLQWSPAVSLPGAPLSMVQGPPMG